MEFISSLYVEIFMAVLGLTVLALGLSCSEKGKNIVGGFSIIALALILVYAVNNFSAQATLFSGIYQADVFANFFKILFLVAALLVMLSSSTYIKGFASRSSEFYSFMIFATLGMMVLSSAGDFITLYIGLELMTVSFYILTAYLLNDKLSSEAGLKYLILGAISSAILLFGMSLIFGLTGTTVISEVISRLTFQPALVAGIILMAAGFAFKVSLIPFHMWSPDIYQGAPIPVTTFLAVGSKAAALAAMVRVFIVAFPGLADLGFNWHLLLSILAVITIVAGNLMALPQTNIKRLLAYSSIAQAGYMIVGLVAGNAYGLQGVLFYAMLYVFANAGAFAVATVVEVDTGSTEIEALAGLGRRSPFLALIMTISFLSLAGIPPMAGFVGKLYLFTGAVQEGYLWLAFIGLIMSMVSAYYYLNVAKVIYADTGERTDEVNITMPVRFALWICLLGTLFIGIYPAPLSAMAQQAIGIFGL